MSRIDTLNLKRAVVAVNLSCRRCRYNLRGLRLDRECPECGLPVTVTVTEAIDPATTDLPQLHNPRAVGNGLLVLMISLLAAGVLICLPPTLDAVGAVVALSALHLEARIKAILLLAAAGALLLGAVATRLFRPPPQETGDPATIRTLRFVVLGLVIVAIIAVLNAGIEVGRASLGGSSIGQRGVSPIDDAWLRFGYAVGAILALLGIGRILTTIGLRSRTYRESRGGRQGVQSMMLAILFITIASTLPLIKETRETGWLWTSARVVVASSTLMLLVGLMYLVANAGWIRAGLKRPSRRLRDLVRIEPDTSFLGAPPGKPETGASGKASPPQTPPRTDE